MHLYSEQLDRLVRLETPLLSPRANLNGPCFILLLELFSTNLCIFWCLLSAVIFIFRWLSSSILLTVLCLYELYYFVSLFLRLLWYFVWFFFNFFVLFVHDICCYVFLYVVAYRFYFLCIFCTIFLFFAKIDKMARIDNDSDYIDLSEPVDLVSISFVVYP